MQVVHERCCGLDVHKKTVVARVLRSNEDGTLERLLVLRRRTRDAEIDMDGSWVAMERKTGLSAVAAAAMGANENRGVVEGSKPVTLWCCESEV